MFTGKDTDEETGLSYHWNRWRSEDGSVWLSEDPARDGSNWYGYCGNNPLVYTDPNGLSTTLDDWNYQQRTNDPDKSKKKQEYYNQKEREYDDRQYNPWRYYDQFVKSVSTQLDFLHYMYNRYNIATPEMKAKAAKDLRDEIRNKAKFNLDGLFFRDEIFMNENLRDFLNTSDLGKEYNLLDILILSNDSESGWYLEEADSEHQYGVPEKDNRKYVNRKDGREVVFDKNGNVVDGINKGTFNYGLPHAGIGHAIDWMSCSAHGKYDMDPFFRQYSKNPIYRSLFGKYYSSKYYGHPVLRMLNPWWD